jgi:hypothetical protein
MMDVLPLAKIPKAKIAKVVGSGSACLDSASRPA